MTATRAPATHHRTMASPIGTLTLAGHGDTVTHLRMDDQSHPPAGREAWTRDQQAFGAVVEQLEAYFAGDLVEFDVVVELEGTEFQRRVWSALLEIPYGETWSYGELAAHIGQPTASRAVGLANGRNRVAIIVPCHRVIGANGSMTGYGGGLDRKRWLLGLEHDRDQPRLDILG
jgi:methylated-DNA-[protein]-cysteine S-methyltransferase